MQCDRMYFDGPTGSMFLVGTAKRPAHAVNPQFEWAGGGFATLLVVALVRAVWPQLVRIGPLHTLAPAGAAQPVADAQMAMASAKADD